MDGVQVTTVVSIVGGVVGFIALTVAWSQMRIASAKTKLDLYNKRFNVYLAAMEFYQCAYSEQAKDIKERSNKLTHACRESRFLFDTKDQIHKTLKRIHESGGIITAYETLKRNVHTPEERGALVVSYGGYLPALSNMGEDLLSLEEQLTKYLSFHNVRGWTFF